MKRFFELLALIAAVLVASSDGSLYQVHINAGATTASSAPNASWLPDTGFEGGDMVVSHGSLGQPYDTSRTGNATLAYTLPVPAPGTYIVELFWGSLPMGFSPSSKFDVIINGQPELLQELVTAVEDSSQSFETFATEDIRIILSAASGLTYVSGISIYEVTVSTATTSFTTSTTTTTVTDDAFCSRAGLLCQFGTCQHVNLTTVECVCDDWHTGEQCETPSCPMSMFYDVIERKCESLTECGLYRREIEAPSAYADRVCSALPCDTSPCQNGGTCTNVVIQDPLADDDGSGSGDGSTDVVFRCTCPASWDGEDCTTPATPPPSSSTESTSTTADVNGTTGSGSTTASSDITTSSTSIDSSTTLLTTTSGSSRLSSSITRSTTATDVSSTSVATTAPGTTVTPTPPPSNADVISASSLAPLVTAQFLGLAATTASARRSTSERMLIGGFESSGLLHATLGPASQSLHVLPPFEAVYAVELASDGPFFAGAEVVIVGSATQAGCSFGLASQSFTFALSQGIRSIHTVSCTTDASGLCVVKMVLEEGMNTILESTSGLDLVIEAISGEVPASLPALAWSMGARQIALGELAPMQLHIDSTIFELHSSLEFESAFEVEEASCDPFLFLCSFSVEGSRINFSLQRRQPGLSGIVSVTLKYATQSELFSLTVSSQATYALDMAGALVMYNEAGPTFNIPFFGGLSSESGDNAGRFSLLQTAPLKLYARFDRCRLVPSISDYSTSTVTHHVLSQSGDWSSPDDVVCAAGGAVGMQASLPDCIVHGEQLGTDRVQVSVSSGGLSVVAMAEVWTTSTPTIATVNAVPEKEPNACATAAPWVPVVIHQQLQRQQTNLTMDVTGLLGPLLEAYGDDLELHHTPEGAVFVRSTGQPGSAVLTLQNKSFQLQTTNESEVVVPQTITGLTLTVTESVVYVSTESQVALDLPFWLPGFTASGTVDLDLEGVPCLVSTPNQQFILPRSCSVLPSTLLCSPDTQLNFSLVAPLLSAASSASQFLNQYDILNQETTTITSSAMLAVGGVVLQAPANWTASSGLTLNSTSGPIVEVMASSSTTQGQEQVQASWNSLSSAIDLVVETSNATIRLSIPAQGVEQMPLLVLQTGLRTVLTPFSTQLIVSAAATALPTNVTYQLLGDDQLLASVPVAFEESALFDGVELQTIPQTLFVRAVIGTQHLDLALAVSLTANEIIDLAPTFADGRIKIKATLDNGAIFDDCLQYSVFQGEVIFSEPQGVLVVSQAGDVTALQNTLDVIDVSIVAGSASSSIGIYGNLEPAAYDVDLGQPEGRVLLPTSAGATLEVAVRVNAGAGLDVFQFTVNYNATQLEFASFTLGTIAVMIELEAPGVILLGGIGADLAGIVNVGTLQFTAKLSDFQTTALGGSIEVMDTVRLESTAPPTTSFTAGTILGQLGALSNRRRSTDCVALAAVEAVEDCRLDLKDAQYMLNKLSSGQPWPGLDVDGDGVLTFQDVEIVMTAAMGRAPLPALTSAYQVDTLCVVRYEVLGLDRYGVPAPFDEAFAIETTALNTTSIINLTTSVGASVMAGTSMLANTGGQLSVAWLLIGKGASIALTASPADATYATKAQLPSVMVGPYLFETYRALDTLAVPDCKVIESTTSPEDTPTTLGTPVSSSDKSVADWVVPVVVVLVVLAVVLLVVVLRYRKSKASNVFEVACLRKTGAFWSPTPHPWISDGHEMGFALRQSVKDNFELGKALHLVRGKRYYFHMCEVPADYPFYFSTSDFGGGNGMQEYLKGVQGTPGVDFDEIVFDVPAEAPDTLYYQCTHHKCMGGVIRIYDSEKDIDLSTTTKRSGIYSDAEENPTFRSQARSSHAYSDEQTLPLYNPPPNHSAARSTMHDRISSLRSGTKAHLTPINTSEGAVALQQEPFTVLDATVPVLQAEEERAEVALELTGMRAGIIAPADSSPTTGSLSSPEAANVIDHGHPGPVQVFPTPHMSTFQQQPRVQPLVATVGTASPMARALATQATDATAAVGRDQRVVAGVLFLDGHRVATEEV